MAEIRPATSSICACVIARYSWPKSRICRARQILMRDQIKEAPRLVRHQGQGATYVGGRAGGIIRLIRPVLVPGDVRRPGLVLARLGGAVARRRARQWRRQWLRG